MSCVRFIKVNGWGAEAPKVAVTKYEILTGINEPDDLIPALVEVGDHRGPAQYHRPPFPREPDFGVTGVTYDLPKLLARAEGLW